MEDFIALLGGFNQLSIAFRLFFSLCMGSIIGIDRFKKGSSAGPKTHSLVCLGSSLVMITSQYCMINYGALDITRLPAQVISGIGFLCAGTIMVTGKNQIKGLTTAAGLWLSGCIGLTVGIGFYYAAFISVLFVIFIYKIFGKFDTHFRRNSFFELYLEFTNETSIGKIIKELKANNCNIVGLDQNRIFINENGAQTNYAMIMVHSLNYHSENDISETLRTLDGILIVEEI